MANMAAGQADAKHDNRAPEEAKAAEGGLDAQWLLGAMRRRAWLIGAGLTVGLTYGAWSVYTMVPHYTARSVILMSGPNVRAINDLYASELANTAALDSEIELIRSDRIARTAAVRLAKNQQFRIPSQPPVASLMDQVRATASGIVRVLSSDAANAASVSPAEKQAEAAAAPQSAEERVRSLVGQISGGLSARRVKQTLLVEIAFTGLDQNGSAAVANAYAEAYIAEQRATKAEAAQSAGRWLETQASELRQKVQEAELAVRKFKADHHISAADETTATDARNSATNQHLSEIRTEISRAQAKYDHIRQIIDSRKTEAVFSEVLDSSIIEQLRVKHLDMVKREADVSRHYGAKHMHAVRLRQEMAQTEKFIFTELGRIASNYQKELDIARAREAALNADMDTATGKALTDSTTFSELNTLTHRADLYKVQLRNVMQRYEETVQQQTLPNLEARVVSVASPPSIQDEPGKFRTLFMSMLLGAMGLGGAGVAREMMDRSFRTGDQIRCALRMPFFGFAPRLKPNRARKDATLTGTVMKHVVENPRSSFAEALRAIRLAITKRPTPTRGRILGVISTLPGEGKTAVAKNLASFLAAKGVKTLLIDGDLRNPGLTRSMTTIGSRGLIDAVRGESSLREALTMETETELDILAAQAPGRVPDSAEFMASPEMSALLQKARQEYDQIIIDLPPLNAVLDVRAAEHVIDDFLLVVEWGKTARSAVTHALDLEQEIRAKCLGAVLNKVDVDAMRQHERSHSREYYHRHCNSYYVNSAS